MQGGSYKVNGKFWWFKYREDVIEGGVRKRKDRQVKLCLVDHEHQPKADGDAPNSVKQLAVPYLAKVNSREHTPMSADSLESFLDNFLEKGVGGRGEKLADSTLGSYRDHMRLIRPHLSDIEINRVNTPYIDRMLRSLADADDARDEGRRAHSVYRNLKNSFLCSAFKYAVREGLIAQNPTRDAAIPKGKDADTYAYSLAEFHSMMKALDKEGTDKNHTASALFVVAMFTGLRISEIKGLRWEDYDKKKQQLNVRRAVVEGKIKETKTDASEAPVPVVKIVQEKLEAHLKRNSGDGFIFHAENDSQTPLRIENLIARDIRPVLEKNKVEWHAWHAFRRGLSTELHAGGTDPLRIKHILRHEISASDVAGRHYIKPSVEESLKEIRKVEARYKRLR